MQKGKSRNKGTTRTNLDNGGNRRLTDLENFKVNRLLIVDASKEKYHETVMRLMQTLRSSYDAEFRVAAEGRESILNLRKALEVMYAWINVI